MTALIPAGFPSVHDAAPRGGAGVAPPRAPAPAQAQGGRQVGLWAGWAGLWGCGVDWCGRVGWGGVGCLVHRCLSVFNFLGSA